MPSLIETPQDHVAFHLGQVVIQGIGLQCAVEQRDKIIAEQAARIAELEKAQAARGTAAEESEYR